MKLPFDFTVITFKGPLSYLIVPVLSVTTLLLLIIIKQLHLRDCL